MPTNFQIPLMSSSKARPDMAVLRLIVESELRCGKVIGSGAFGTVYEVSHRRLPVAIPGGTCYIERQHYENSSMLNDTNVLCT